MKTNHPSLLVIATAALLLGGCATSATRHSDEVLVCPQCRTVQHTERLPFNSRRGGSRTVTHYRHECPGCHSAMESFVKSGKWQHKCSTCEGTAFTCPTIHPSL